jgi:hypothetical protein
MEMLLDFNTKNLSECKIRYAGHCHITLGYLQFCKNDFVQIPENADAKIIMNESPGLCVCGNG